MKSYALRTWPNGEFGIGAYRRYNPEGFQQKYEDVAEVRYSWVLSELQSLPQAVGTYGSLSEALKRLCPGLHEAIMNEILSSENADRHFSEEGKNEAGGERSDLGSSNASNSHRSLPRGSNGLTSYGRRMVRNGCWLLEKQVKRGGVGMITCTIPTCSIEVQREIVENWPDILRTFTQWLYRKLKAGGSKFPGIVGVNEIQEKRQQREGGLPLHLHLVFCSRSHSGHIVSKRDVADAWKRAVCSRVSSAKTLWWGASTRVETVRKSVAKYMSKYLSKGSPEAMRRAVEEGFTPPSAWWFMAGKMKSVIRSMVGYYTDERANSIWGLAHSNPEIFEYVHKVSIPLKVRTFNDNLGGNASKSEAREIVIGMAGKMTRAMLDWVRNFAPC